MCIFLLVAFVREHVWHKAFQMRYSMRLEFIPVSSIIYISSSSYRAGSTDITDPLSPLLPIVHRPR